MHKLSMLMKERIEAVIVAHYDRLREIPGFVDAEPGFRIVNGWVRREPAIIVHVEQKKPVSELLPEEIAPRTLGEFRVDVISAGPLRQLERRPDLHEVSLALASVAKLTYEKRPDNPIDTSFDISRPILCHVGPDAGWPVLKKFLEGTRDTLTAAMYDLNAAYIAKVLVETIRDNSVKFVLTWDSGMTGDEPAIRTDLKKRLAGAMDAWLVVTGSGRRFDSAYHEKVAVRDSSSFWLSSGNWSKRSQPDLDPIAEPSQARGMYGKGNREWHIVVDDAPLSNLYEAYILYDRDQSKGESTALGVPVAVPFPDVFVPLENLIPDENLALAAVEPVAPKRLPSQAGTFKVQPVLCPDNYIDQITVLVQSAKHSLYLQYAYITYSDAVQDKPFQGLLDYIGELSHKQDFDLRVIVGNNDAPDKVRKLVEAGFNETSLRVQGNIHNKGIVVDGEAVLVSSANWSSAGCLRNRDAGLIIYQPEIAKYFADVFIDDWNVRARSDFGRSRPVMIAAAGEPTPPGMVRMRWSDYNED